MEDATTNTHCYSDHVVLQEALTQVLDELLPSTANFTGQSGTSLIIESAARFLHHESIERCEDPLIEARYHELSQIRQRFTPKRFDGASKEQSSTLIPTAETSNYSRFTPGEPNHPGKRQATSPPPEHLDRDLDIMDRFSSPRHQRRALRAEWRKRTRYTADTSEVYRANAWKLEETPISTTGWQGTHATAWERKKVRAALLARSPSLMDVLAGYKLVHYETINQAATRIVDQDGRLFIYRSKRAEWQAKLLPELGNAIREFTENTVISREDRSGNNRGLQKFCIAGMDRQSKGVPKECSWHRRANNSTALDKLMANRAMAHFNTIASDLVRQHFPMIAKRMSDAQNTLKDKYDVPQSPFGLFHNFCINSPVFEEGIPDVFCMPHTDAHNAAILVCVVMVYYYGNCETNADERIWLVFWEAGVIVQVPAGVFIVYPSALFLHFNVHIEDVLKVTTGGDPPTQENLKPFKESSVENGGRGSIVWFTQASMMMSAELPTDSLKEARKLNETAQAEGRPLITTSFDASEALKVGFFPYDASPKCG